MSTTPNPDPAALSMAKKRWAIKTPAQRKEHSQMMSKALAKARRRKARAARVKNPLA